MNIAATAINLLLDSSPLFSSSPNAENGAANPLNLIGDVTSLLGGGTAAGGVGSSLLGSLAGSIAGILA